MAFAGKDKYIYLIDSKSLEVITKSRAHNNYINSIAVDEENDAIYSVSNDITMKIWIGAQNKQLVLQDTFWGHTNKVFDIEYISKDRLISCGLDNQIILWKIESSSYLLFKLTNYNSIDMLKVLNNNSFISGDLSGNILLWKTDKKKPLFNLLNAHGYSKQFDFRKSFEEKYYFNYHKNNSQNKDDIVNDNRYLCEIPFPILSLASSRNTDLILSGSNNGNLNTYKFDPISNTIKLINTNKIKSYCVNDIKIDKNNEFACLAYGKDGKFGRIDTVKKRKKMGLVLLNLKIIIIFN